MPNEHSREYCEKHKENYIAECGPCNKEARELEEAYARGRRDAVRFIKKHSLAGNFDWSVTPATLEAAQEGEDNKTV